MAMEIAQVRHQPVAGEGRGGIDHQLVGLAVLVEATDPRGQLLEQGLGGAEQIEASVGQAHLASVAKEQRLLEIAFQAADLLADRRLGECSSSAALWKLPRRAAASKPRRAFSGGQCLSIADKPG